MFVDLVLILVDAIREIDRLAPIYQIRAVVFAAIATPLLPGVGEQSSTVSWNDSES